MNLKEIIENFNLSTDKNSDHSYVDYFYEKEFVNYKDKKINLLEVGIYKGGSIILWDKYFSDASIYAFDIIKNVENNNLLPNVNYYFTDAYNNNLLEEVYFDIAIDDGPHTFESQASFLNKYLPKMNKNGILIIEDVQDIKWCDTFKKLANNYTNEIVDMRSIKNRWDDILFVVRT